eukprot:355943-Chlamydomonas_euryale.AAC.1
MLSVACSILCHCPQGRCTTRKACEPAAVLCAPSRSAANCTMCSEDGEPAAILRAAKTVNRQLYCAQRRR